MPHMQISIDPLSSTYPLWVHCLHHNGDNQLGQSSDLGGNIAPGLVDPQYVAAAVAATVVLIYFSCCLFGIVWDWGTAAVASSTMQRGSQQGYLGGVQPAEVDTGYSHETGSSRACKVACQGVLEH